MATKYGRRTSKILAQQEREVYKRLLVVLSIVVIVIFIIFFWGFQILVKFADFLTWVQGSNQTSSTQSTIPPASPDLDSLPPATNSAQIKITGTAESGSELEIFINNNSRERLLVGADGKFKVENFTLQEGKNDIQAFVTNKSGVKSQPSPLIEIIFDKTKPSLEISKPNNGDTITGSSNRIEIEGQTDPDNSVTVNGYWAIVDQEGKFTYNYSLSDGENKLTIEASDIAGNKTVATRKVFYSR
jgi:hypothetical protein